MINLTEEILKKNMLMLNRAGLIKGIYPGTKSLNPTVLSTHIVWMKMAVRSVVEN